MVARTRSSIIAAALSIGLVFTGSADASPVNDVPEFAFENIVTPTDGFATISTGSTQVDPELPPVDTGGQAPSTENSPEPGTLTLLGLGGFGAWWRLRRCKTAAGQQ